MTDNDQVQTLLAELVEHEPPSTLDMDAHIAKGRRQAHRRTALACVAVLAFPAMAVGVTYAVRPAEPPVAANGLPGEPVTGTPTTPWDKVPTVGDLPTKATAKSRLLLKDFERLIPELRQHPELKHSSGGWSDGKKLTPHLSAHALYEEPDRVPLAITVEIGDRKAGATVPRICESADGPPDGPHRRCDAIRRLPDQSLAFFQTQNDGHNETHSLRLARPDGIQILVSVELFHPVRKVPTALLSEHRLLQIARGISTEP
ncbi:hypothetical protein [Kribbella deserti]|uniref:Uncharacterized protein n=1 Tax=Kribbella deserti TaxID=1926257 RepID=A0ABV6QVD0_9ACTN